MIDWNLQGRSHVCQACARHFVDKQPYHTLLFDERRDYQRQDICPECWASQYSLGAADRKGFISHWQGLYEAPPAAPPDAIQKDTAESLLRKLTQQNDPQYRAVCYILAVMLERKRLLKIKAQSRDGGKRIFIYEQPKTGDVFTIADPNLQLDQLEDVQRQVAHLLEHGLAMPAETTPTPPAPIVEAVVEVPVEVPAPSEVTHV